MKTIIRSVFFISILITVECSFTLPGNEKSNANKSNGIMLALLSVLNTPPATILFVPNLDTTKPFLSVVNHRNGVNTFVSNITLETNPGDATGTANNHLFANLTNSNKTAVFNVTSSGADFLKYIDTGSRPVHIYQDPAGKIWVMNDGNNGVDNVNAACNGSAVGSVTIIQDGAKGAAANDSGTLIKHLCVGKGHHKAIFTSSPKRAFVSSITDSTVSVIDNDPSSGTYLTVISTLSLGAGAGPHGFSYSSVSGKVYASAQTAGTVVSIDPGSLNTQTISTSKSGPSASSPSGQYIAIPGKDTTTDSNHVIGKVTILNVSTNALSTVDVSDVSPDHAMFSDDGNRLYVASAQAGSGNQVTNLKQNVLLVYDSSALPALTLISQITVGNANSGNRHLASMNHGSMTHVFVPSGDGNLYTVDSMTNSVSQTLNLGGSFNNAHFYTLGSAPTHTH
ncbi:MAG: hypothetical protein K8R21_15005 [Leptospira sp.]|nr:hypothetical protein [Leptospira sp.]